MISIPLIIPFIPVIVVWGVALLLGGMGAKAVAKAFKKPNVKKLGIIGMQGSGKTVFLSFLRNKPFIEGSTVSKSYDSFKYKLSSGKEITISSGVDMGGGGMYTVNYNKILEESDVILYFFDIGRYLRNEMDPDGVIYQRSCNSRFEHIYSVIKKTKKPLLIIATHKDKSGLSEPELEQKFNVLVQNKSYKQILKNIEYVNLTNSWEIANLKHKIFN